MLRGINGKYSKWSDVLKDILEGKITLQSGPSCSNKQPEDTNNKTERARKHCDKNGEESDDDSDWECYDKTEGTSYQPIVTRPEDEITDIPTQEIEEDLNNNTGETEISDNNNRTRSPVNTNTSPLIRGSRREAKPPNRLGGVPYMKNFLR